MLHALGDVDDIACLERDGRLAPLLIPTTVRDADEYLSCSVMYVPVVAATRFEGYVIARQDCCLTLAEVLWFDWSQITIANEELSIVHVRLALWPVTCTGVGGVITLTQSFLAEKFA